MIEKSAASRSFSFESLAPVSVNNPMNHLLDSAVENANDMSSRTKIRWWHEYRDILGSSEMVATLLGAFFLSTGWMAEWKGVPWYRWCHFLAAAIAAMPILRTCLASLIQRRVSIEILVGLAIVTSIWAGEFQAGAVVAVMLLGGGILEQITVARARRHLTALRIHLPNTACVRRGNKEVAVPADALCSGECIIVRPGERIVADGVVIAGESVVDESPITGESLPQDKIAGSRVFAGSINQSGMLEVEAQKVGSQTTFARIIRLVEAAQASRAPIQRVADRVAQWYVPAALATAAVVWALTGNVTRGITVLIVFCPCALVLATPTAIVASLGKAARQVILIKGGQFLECVGRANLVAFDKTGTLTQGRHKVAKIGAMNSLSPSELLTLAASAESFSEHPLGLAICQAAHDQKLEVPQATGFRAVSGCGVEAQVASHHVAVGRASWLAKQSIKISPEVEKFSALMETEGHTVLMVARDACVVGWIALRDTLRPEAIATVARLKNQRLHVAMLTGDNPHVARAIAREANIDEVHAGLMPEEKLRLVRQWQSQGQRVVFVGDGINDAPALAGADIGIAMGDTGTDVALETSDIAFLSDDLMKMPEVVELSRRTLMIIRQNIAFSVALNILSVVAAGWGWISPISGAVIHESSALAVIINAIRLLR